MSNRKSWRRPRQRRRCDDRWRHFESYEERSLRINFRFAAIAERAAMRLADAKFEAYIDRMTKTSRDGWRVVTIQSKDF